MTTKRSEIKPKLFDYVYMFIMIIYMGQATEETSRMVTGLSGNPIPFLIPIILTFYLWSKNRVPLFSRKLWGILSIYLIWMVLSLRKYGVYTTGELSYHFFMVYALVVAYIQDYVYGYRLLILYEKVIVWICKITLFLWLISIIIPGITNLFQLFPKTYLGSNVLYIFQWNGENFRNAGCSWEPGRYAVMLCLGIYCNLCQRGIKFRSNPNLWWLLISLGSTMSTTGFSVALVLFSLFVLKRIRFVTLCKFIGIMLPIAIGFWQLDFMREKIVDKFEDAQNVNRWRDNFEWHNKNTASGTTVSSIDRFEAMVFEGMNITADPLLGYSRNSDHSYFYKHWSKHHALAHGLLKVFGMYGLILGSIFYICLFKSSVTIARQSRVKQPIALFIIICLGSISYQILSIPIFTAFWFFGIFNPK